MQGSRLGPGLDESGKKDPSGTHGEICVYAGFWIRRNFIDMERWQLLTNKKKANYKTPHIA